MSVEKLDVRTADQTASNEKDVELADSFGSSQRDLDEYIQLMRSLRDGTRPILCW